MANTTAKYKSVKVEIAGALLPAIDALINHANKVKEIMHHDLDELHSFGRDEDTLASVILASASEIKDNATQLKINLEAVINQSKSEL